MKTSFFHIIRLASIIFACGLGVAGTSRAMHDMPVQPYYAKLAQGQVKAPDNNIQTTIKNNNEGQTYVRSGVR